MARTLRTLVFFVLLAVACSWGWWLLGRSPEPQVVGVRVDGDKQVATPAAVESLTSLPLAREALGGASSHGPADEVFGEGTEVPIRLVDSDGKPLAGVRYWSDIKPTTGADAVPPEGAASTAGDGTFPRPALGPNEWLWFALAEGLALAAPAEFVASSDTVAAPPIVECVIKIVGLPEGAPCSIVVTPAVIEPDGTFEYGRSRVDTKRFGVDGLLLHRRQVRREMERGEIKSPSSAGFLLVENLPCVLYMDADEYPLEPGLLELDRPRDVVATAGAPLPVVSFEVLEEGGVERSSTGGRAGATRVDRHHASYQAFQSGTGRLSYVEAGFRLGAVLNDGEVLSEMLTAADLVDSDPVQLVRGTGQAAAVTLAAPKNWKGARIAWIGLDGVRTTGAFEHYFPFTDTRHVYGWWHGEEVIIQTTPLGSRREGRIVLIGDHGRQLAVEEAGVLVPWPTGRLEPVDLQEMVGEADSKGVDRRLTLVEFQIRHPQLAVGGSPEWVTLELLRLHVVQGVGWRLSRTNSINVHEAFGPALRFFAPLSAEARIYVRPTDQDPVAWPLAFEE